MTNSNIYTSEMRIVQLDTLITSIDDLIKHLPDDQAIDWLNILADRLVSRIEARQESKVMEKYIAED